MRAAFLEEIEAELATVDRVVDSTVVPVGWGSDLSCAEDLTPECEELEGDNPLVVAQYTYRRITTAPGELPDDPDWGVDIGGRLSSAMGEADLRELQSEVLGEVSRDDRLQNVEVSATLDLESESLELKISAQLVDSGDTFLLTAVSDADGSRLVETIVNGQLAA